MEGTKQMRSSEAKCWKCGEVVYKGTKQCPKCGATSPTADIAKLRKVTPILLRIGIPVGIVSLIVGFIILIKYAGAGFVEAITLMAMGDVSGMFLMVIGLFGGVILIAIGIIGIMIGPILRSFLAKVDSAK